MQIYQSEQDLIPFNSRILVTLIVNLVRKIFAFLLVVLFFSCDSEPVNSCAAPTALTVIDVTTGAAKISWSSMEAGSYEIQLGPNGFTLGEGEILSSTGTSNQIDNLNAGTPYDFYVRTLCDMESISDWSEVESFRTLPNCARITNSTVTNITETAAFISWQFIGDIPIGWIIEYGEEGFLEGQGVIAETSIDNIPLMNLMTGIHYEYYLTSKCAQDNLGERAGPFTFSTL